MKILAIDTSGQTASVAVVDNQLTIGELTANTQGLMTHSEILLDMIDSLFRLTRLTVEDMDYIACVNGPGSFTGLRIGAATAQGLARGASKALLAVPTLDALAYNIGYAAAPGTLVVPMMDARRRQVYTAFYQRDDDASLRRISDYMAIPVPEMLAQLEQMTQSVQSAQMTQLSQRQVIFVGDGASAYEDMVKTASFTYTLAPPNNNRQRAASAGICAIEMIHRQRFMQQDTAHEATRNTTQGAAKDTAQDTVHETTHETTQDTTQDTAQNPVLEYTPAPFTLLYVRKPQAERVRLGENT